MYLYRLTILFIFLLSIQLFSCKKYQDPNAPFYRFLSEKNEKPLRLERRRINLDTSFALETLLVYKNDQNSDWFMTVLKKVGAEENDFEVFKKIRLTDKDDLLDRIVLKDLFIDEFNSIIVEFSRFKGGENLKKKRLLVYRWPYNAPILDKDFSITDQPAPVSKEKKVDLSSSTENSSDSNADDKSFLKWEDVDRDGHYELVIPREKLKDKTILDNKPKDKEFAYSLDSAYENSDLLKFNGFEFIAYQPGKPFLFFREPELPSELKKGEKTEIALRITNLGSYTSKSYISISVEGKAKLEINSLKQFGRVYPEGRGIFHFNKKKIVAASYPLAEFTIFPWPRKQTFTFRLLVTPRTVGNVSLKYRATAEYLGKNIYFPDIQSENIFKSKDQQALSAYFQEIKVK